MTNTTAARFPLHVDPTTPTIDLSTGEIIATTATAPPPTFSTPSYSAATLAGRLVIATGAEYARVTMPKTGPPEKREWRRGSVTHFSARSRSRMLQSMAQVRRDGPSPDALFVTLTYPDAYPASVRRCKAQFSAWWRRFKRKYPDAWLYWKLEFQVRGAAHFHLLIFDIGPVDENWFHQSWYEIVASGDRHHWSYGADVKRLHTWKEAGSYCAKYCAKESIQNVCDDVGRFWGILNRAARPATLVSTEITEGEFFQLRRLFRRYMHQKHGYHQAGGPRSGVWTRISAASAKRALDWASSALNSATAETTPSHAARAPSRDRHEFGTVASSRDGSAVAQQRTTGRMTGRPTTALFDSTDLARRRARRLLA